MSKFDALAPRQKALLTPDLIRKHYLNEVLMERGVNPVLPVLNLEDLPPCPVIEDREYLVVTMKHGFYNSTSLAFETKEALDAFRALSPLCVTWTGIKTEVSPVLESEVALRIFPDHREAQHHRATLKAREDSSGRNKTACAEYDRQVNTIESILDELLGQVQDAQFEGDLATQVNATAEEYLRLCDCDADKARTFLLKVFREDDIERSRAWFKQPTGTPWEQ